MIRHACCVVVAAAFLAAAGCCPHRTPRAAVDARRPPLLAIDVADADEAALVAERLRVTPVRLRGTTLYLRDEPDARARLREAGYAPVAVDAARVIQRVVRIARPRGDGARNLEQAGVSVLLREKDHWIVSGTLAQLALLERAGYRIEAVRGEPRPREVRIPGLTREQVAEVVALHVDVFAVQPAKDGKAVVFGAAFDGQIDAIRARGFAAEVIETVPRGAP